MSGWAVCIELSLPVGVCRDPGTEGFSTEHDVPASLGSPPVSSKGGVERQHESFTQTGKAVCKHVV